MSSRSAYAQHAGQFDFVPNSVFFRNNFDLELKSSSCLCVFRKFGLPLFCLLGKDELSYQVSGLGIPTSSSQKAQRTDASQSMSREYTPCRKSLAQVVTVTALHMRAMQSWWLHCQSAAGQYLVSLSGPTSTDE